nr:MAG TPA_asm: bacteriocin [Caudoviricetes sp.]DAY99775.1 MAG TPA: bacteriocin [Caudoviricetes sp.]
MGNTHSPIWKEPCANCGLSRRICLSHPQPCCQHCTH